MHNLGISPDELFKLRVPDDFWKGIIECSSIDELNRLPIPVEYRELVLAYLSAEGSNQIERMYQEDNDNSLISISERPSSDFLLHLDPQQQTVVNKPLDKGPYLVKGSPGTGKTLILVERIKRMYREGELEYMFSQFNPKIGFITYTKSLVNTTSSIFRIEGKGYKNIDVEFKSFDSIAIKYYRQVGSLKLTESKKSIQIIINLLNKLNDDLHDFQYINEFRKNKGPAFLEEEFENVIIGNGIRQKEVYLNLKRVGRKLPLKQKERGLVWNIYDLYCKELQKYGLITWNKMRLEVLLAFESKRIVPEKYNALFVDEIQDFSVVSLRLITHLVNDSRYITMAADGGQSIYNKSIPWLNISKKFVFNKGNSFQLTKSYRISKQIEKAIRPLRLNIDADNYEASVPVYSGPKPNLITHLDYSFHIPICVRIIKDLVNNQNINPGQIAIITPVKRFLSSINLALKEEDIPSQIISNNKPISTSERVVHILNTHASKGLEFQFVLVPFVTSYDYPNNYVIGQCENQEDKSEVIDKWQTLLYVAMSRAAHQLWVFSDPINPSNYIDLLNKNDWNVESGA